MGHVLDALAWLEGMATAGILSGTWRTKRR